MSIATTSSPKPRFVTCAQLWGAEWVCGIDIEPADDAWPARKPLAQLESVYLGGAWHYACDALSDYCIKELEEAINNAPERHYE